MRRSNYKYDHIVTPIESLKKKLIKGITVPKKTLKKASISNRRRHEMTCICHHPKLVIYEDASLGLI